MKKKQQKPRYVQGELWPELALENFMGGCCKGQKTT